MSSDRGLTPREAVVALAKGSKSKLRKASSSSLVKSGVEPDSAPISSVNAPAPGSAAFRSRSPRFSDRSSASGPGSYTPRDDVKYVKHVLPGESEGGRLSKTPSWVASDQAHVYRSVDGPQITTCSVPTHDHSPRTTIPSSSAVAPSSKSPTRVRPTSSSTPVEQWKLASKTLFSQRTPLADSDSTDTPLQVSGRRSDISSLSTPPSGSTRSEQLTQELKQRQTDVRSQLQMNEMLLSRNAGELDQQLRTHESIRRRETVQRRLDDLQSQMQQQLETTTAFWKEQVVDKDREIERLRNELIACESMAAKLRQQLEEEGARATQFDHQLQLTQYHTAALQQQLDAALSGKKQVQGHLDEITAKNSLLTQQLDASEAHRGHLQEQLDNLGAKMQSHVSELKGHLTQQQSTIQMLQEKSEQTNTEREQLVKQYSEATTQVEDLKNLLAQVQEQLAIVTKDWSAAEALAENERKENDRLRAELALKAKQILDTSAQLEASRQQATALCQDVERMKTTFSDAVSVHIEEKGSLNAQMVSVKDQMGQLGALLQAHQEQYKTAVADRDLVTQQLQVANVQLADLQQQLRHSADMMNTTNEFSQKIQDRLVVAEKQISESVSAHRATLALLDEAHAARTKAQDLADERQAQNAHLVDEYKDQLAQLHRSYQEQLSQLGSTLKDDAGARIGRVSSERDVLKSSLESYEQRCKSLEEALADKHKAELTLQSELSVLTSRIQELQTSSAAAEARFSDKEKQNDAKVSALVADLDDLRAKFSECQVRCAVSESSVLRLEESSAQLQQALLQERTGKEAIEKELNQYRTEAGALQLAKQELEIRSSALASDNETLNHTITQLNRKALESQSALSVSESKLSELIASSSRERETLLSKLDSSAIVHKNELERVYSEVVDVKQSRQSIQQQLDRANAEVLESAKQLAEATASAAVTRTMLEENVKQAHDRSEQLQSTLTNREVTISGLKKDLSESDKLISSLRSQVAEMEKVTTDDKRELSANAETIRALEKDLAYLRAQLVDVNTQLSSTQSELADRSQELHTLNGDHTRIQTELQSSVSDCERLRVSEADLQQVLRALRHEHEELERHKEQQERDLASVQMSHETALSSLQSSQHSVTAHVADKESLTQQLADAQAQLTDCQAQLQATRDDVSLLRASLAKEVEAHELSQQSASLAIATLEHQLSEKTENCAASMASLEAMIAGHLATIAEQKKEAETEAENHRLALKLAKEQHENELESQLSSLRSVLRSELALLDKNHADECRALQRTIQTEVDSHLQAIADLTVRYDAQTADRDRVQREQLVSLQTQCDAQVAQLKASHADTVASLKSIVAGLEESLQQRTVSSSATEAELQSQLRGALSRESGLSSDLAAATSRIKDLEERLERVRQASDDELEQVRASLKSVQHDLDALTSDHTTSQASLANSQKEFASSQQRCNQLQEELSSVQDTTSSLSAKLSSANATIEGLQQSLSDAQAKLVSEAEAHQTAFDKLKAVSTAASQAIQQDRDAWRDKCQQMELSTAEHAQSLQTNISQLMVQKAELTALLAGAESRIDVLQKQLVSVSEEMSQEIGNWKGRASSLQTDLDKVKTDLTADKDSLSNLLRTDMESQRAELSSQIAKLESQLQLSQSECSDLRLKLASADSLAATQKDNLDVLSGSLRDANQQHREELAAMQSEHAFVLQRLQQSADGQQAALRERIVSLESSSAALTVQLSRSSAEVDDLTKEVERLSLAAKEIMSVHAEALIAERDRNVLALSSQASRFSETEKMFQSQLALAESLQADLGSRLTASQAQNSALQAELVSAGTRLIVTISQHKADLEQMQESNREAATRLSAQHDAAVADLKAQVSQLDGMNQELESRLKSSLMNASELNERLVAAQKSLVDSERSHHEALVNALETHSANLQRIRAEHDAGVVELRSKLSASEQSVNELETKLNGESARLASLKMTLSDERAAAESRATADRKRIDELEAQLIKQRSVMDGVIAELRSRLAAAEQRVSELGVSLSAESQRLEVTQRDLLTTRSDATAKAEAFLKQIAGLESQVQKQRADSEILVADARTRSAEQDHRIKDLEMKLSTESERLLSSQEDLAKERALSAIRSESDSKKLTETNTSLQALRESSSATITELESTLAAAEQRYAELDRKHQTVLSRAEADKAEYSDERQKSSLRLEADSKRISGLEDLLKAARADIAKMTIDHSASEARSADLQQRLTLAAADLAAMSERRVRELDQSAAKLKELQAAYDSTAASLARATSEMETLRPIKSSLNEQLIASQERVSGLDEECRASKQALAASQVSLAAAEADISALRPLLEAAQASVSELQQTRDSLSVKLSKSQQEHQGTKSQLGQLKSSFAQIEEKLASVTGERDKLAVDLSSLTVQLSASQEELRGTQAAFTTARSEHQASVTELKDSLASTSVALSASQKSVAELSVRLHECEERLRAAQDSLVNTRADAEKTLSARVTQLTSEIQDGNLRLSSCVDHIKLKEADLRDAAARYVALQAELSEKLAEADRSRQEALKEQDAVFDSRLAAVQAQMDAAVVSRSETAAQLASVKEDLRLATDRLVATEAAHAKMLEAVKLAASENVAQLTQQLDSLRETHDQQVSSLRTDANLRCDKERDLFSARLKDIETEAAERLSAEQAEHQSSLSAVRVAADEAKSLLTAALEKESSAKADLFVQLEVARRHSDALTTELDTVRTLQAETVKSLSETQSVGAQASVRITTLEAQLASLEEQLKQTLSLHQQSEASRVAQIDTGADHLRQRDDTISELRRQLDASAEHVASLRDDLGRAKSEIIVVTNDLKLVQSALAEAVAKLPLTQAVADKYQAELLESQSQRSALQTAVEEQSAVVVALQRQLAESGEKLATTQADLHGLKLQMNDLTSSLTQRDLSLEAAMKEIQHKDTHISDARAQVQDLRDELKATEASMNELRALLHSETLQKESTALQLANSVTQCAELLKGLEGEKVQQAELRKQLDETFSTLQHAQTQLNDGESKIIALTSQMDQLNVTFASVTRDLDVERARAHQLAEELALSQDSFHRVSAELEAASANLQAANVRLEETHATVTVQSKELARIQETLAAKSQECVDLHRDVDVLRSQLDAMTDKEQHYRSENDKANQRALDESHQVEFLREFCNNLQRNVDKERSELAIAQSQLTHSQNQLDEFTSVVGGLKEEIVGLHASTDLMRNELAAREAALLAHQDSAMISNAELEQLNQRLASVLAENASFTSQLQDAERLMSEQSAQVQMFAASVSTLEQELHAAKSRAEHVTGKNHAIQRQLTEEQARLSHIQQALVDERKNATEAREQIRNLQKTMAESREHLLVKEASASEKETALSAELAERTAELAALTLQCKQVTDELAAVQEKLSGTTAQLDQKTQEQTSTAEVLASQSAKLAVSEEVVQSHVAHISELEAEKTKLQSVVKALEAQVNELQEHHGSLSAVSLMSESELADVRKKLSEADGEILRLQAAVEEVKQEAQSARDERDTVLAERAVLEHQFVDLTQVLEEKDQAIVANLTTIALYHEQAGAAVAHIQDLESEKSKLVQSAQEEKDSLEKRNQKTEKARLQLQKLLDDSKVEYSAAVKEIAALQMQVGEVVPELQAQLETYKVREKEWVRQQSALESQMVEAVGDAQSSMGDLKKTMFNQAKEIERLNESVGRLQQEAQLAGFITELFPGVMASTDKENLEQLGATMQLLKGLVFPLNRNGCRVLDRQLNEMDGWTDKSHLLKIAHSSIKKIILAVAGEQGHGGRWQISDEQISTVPSHSRRTLLQALQQLVIAYDNEADLDMTTVREIVQNASSLVKLATIVKIKGAVSSYSNSLSPRSESVVKRLAGEGGLLEKGSVSRLRRPPSMYMSADATSVQLGKDRLASSSPRIPRSQYSSQGLSVPPPAPVNPSAHAMRVPEQLATTTNEAPLSTDDIDVMMNKNGAQLTDLLSESVESSDDDETVSEMTDALTK